MAQVKPDRQVDWSNEQHDGAAVLASAVELRGCEKALKLRLLWLVLLVYLTFFFAEWLTRLRILKGG